MQDDEIVWEWFNGLVRRTSLGVVLFVILALVSVGLVSSQLSRERELEQLGRLANLHARYVIGFRAVADLGIELAGRDARAKEALEPLRLGLTDSKLKCASARAPELLAFQRSASQLASACAGNGPTCAPINADFRIDQLAALERGFLASEDLISRLERSCFAETPDAPICQYYRQNREKTITRLSQFTSKYPRLRLTAEERRSLDADREKEDCLLEAHLTHYDTLVRQIDPSARMGNLQDFVELDDSIFSLRQSLQAQNPNITTAPAGGVVTITLPQSFAYLLTNALCLIGIIYALLNLSKLARLLTLTGPAMSANHYRHFPAASHMFTTPVFGHRVPQDPQSHGHRDAISMRLITLIPCLALVCAIAAWGVLIVGDWAFDRRGFDWMTEAVAGILLLSQVVALRAYYTARQTIDRQFFALTPQNISSEMDERDT